MSPRAAFEAILLDPVSESPKLTIIVPPMQSKTPINFTQVNCSPKNIRESKKVNRLEELLKIVLDCKEVEKPLLVTHRVALGVLPKLKYKEIQNRT